MAALNVDADAANDFVVFYTHEQICTRSMSEARVRIWSNNWLCNNVEPRVNIPCEMKGFPCRNWEKPDRSKPIETMRLNDMSIFVTVAEHGSFTAAAEATNQPADTLSRGVTRLEKQLGMRLFVRSTRHLALTELGAAYLKRCAPLIAATREAHDSLHDLNAQPTGPLRISMPVSLALLLPDAIEAFIAEHPGVTCDLDLSMDDIDPIENPYDIVLRFGRQPDSALVSRMLAGVPHQLYASQDYLSRRGTPGQPADLAGHDCLRPVIDQTSATWTLHCGPEAQTVSIHGRIGANSIALCCRFAAQGLGITPLPVVPAMRKAVQEWGLIRVLPDWAMAPFPLFALLPSRTPSARAEAFLTFLQPRLGGASLARDQAALSKLHTE